MKKKKAFTLIELLVVVAIMGLLSAVAVIALNNARARARDAKRVADIKQIQTALELYYLDMNEYPDEPTGTKVIGALCLDKADGFAAGCSDPTYMALVSENPEPRTDGTCTNTKYTYTAAATGGSNLSYQIRYCLGSAIGGNTAGVHVATPAGITDP